MSFGLSNAPRNFQRLMERCLEEISFKTVLVYLKDFIIFPKTYEDHIKHVDRVFLRLAQWHLMWQKTQHLEHVVEAGGVTLGPAKVQTVQGWHL